MTSFQAEELTVPEIRAKARALQNELFGHLAEETDLNDDYRSDGWKYSDYYVMELALDESADTIGRIEALIEFYSELSERLSYLPPHQKVYIPAEAFLSLYRKAKK